MVRLAGLTLVLVVALAAAGCYESDGGSAQPATTEQPPATTEQPPATTAAPAPGGDAAAGEAVFASAGCSACHTLAAANASGAVGPNLDETKPGFDLVVDRVTNGKGIMPPFSGQLSEQQIKDVAAFVSQSAGS
jgi:mono/diheme cytochrome c family protein